jgi:hypothetical protein
VIEPRIRRMLVRPPPRYPALDVRAGGSDRFAAIGCGGHQRSRRVVTEGSTAVAGAVRSAGPATGGRPQRRLVRQRGRSTWIFDASQDRGLQGGDFVRSASYAQGDVYGPYSGGC